MGAEAMLWVRKIEEGRGPCLAALDWGTTSDFHHLMDSSTKPSKCHRRPGDPGGGIPRDGGLGLRSDTEFPSIRIWKRHLVLA